MAGFFNFANIATAVHNKMNKFDLSSNTITSQDFYKLQPITFRHVFPNESFEFDCSSYITLAPMFKPLLGSAKVVNRFFFVPFWQVMKGFNDFFNQTPLRIGNNSNVIPSECWWFSDFDLWTAFLNKQLVIPTRGNEAHDFVAWNYDGDPPYSQNYRLSRKGKFVHDIFNSLGYKVLCPVNMDMELQDHRNALPLLAYLKIFYDWFSNSSYMSFEYFKQQFEALPYSNDWHIDVSSLIDMVIDTMYIQVESNYFTACWDNPIGPNSSVVSRVPAINDPTISVASASSMVNEPSGFSSSWDKNTPTIQRNGGSGTVVNISQFVIDALKSATDFMVRKHLSGNRLVDQYKTQKGIASNIDEMNRCVQIGHFETPIKFGEIYSSTEAQSGEGVQPLGDYAGFGKGGSSNNHFKFDAQSQAGIIIGVSYIIPDITFVDGIHRFNSTTTALDFYQEDFDHLGVQMIRKDEFATSPIKDIYDGVAPSQKFGYIPRYAHLKCNCNLDILNGDFYHRSTRGMYDRWHLWNNMDDLLKGSRVEQSTGIVPEHNAALMSGDYYNEQFHRIFADDSENFDHFFNIYSFKVTKYSTMSTLWDNYEFNKEDEHRHVTVNVNGTNLSN